MIENLSNQKEPFIYSVNSLEFHTQSKYYKVIDWPIRWCQRWIQFTIRTIQTKKTVTAQFDKLVKIRRRRAAAEKKNRARNRTTMHITERVSRSLQMICKTNRTASIEVNEAEIPKGGIERCIWKAWYLGDLCVYAFYTVLFIVLSTFGTLASSACWLKCQNRPCVRVSLSLYA